MNSCVRFLAVLVLFVSCNYGAGNRSVMLTLQPNMKSEYILRIIDSLQSEGNYLMEKNEFEEYFDLKPISKRSRLIYFSSNPKEVYEVSFTFATFVDHIYDINAGIDYGGKIENGNKKRVETRLLNFLRTLREKGNELKFSKEEMYLAHDKCDDSILLCDRHFGRRPQLRKE